MPVRSTTAGLRAPDRSPDGSSDRYPDTSQGTASDTVTYTYPSTLSDNLPYISTYGHRDTCPDMSPDVVSYMYPDGFSYDVPHMDSDGPLETSQETSPDIVCPDESRYRSPVTSPDIVPHADSDGPPDMSADIVPYVYPDGSPDEFSDESPARYPDWMSQTEEAGTLMRNRRLKAKRHEHYTAMWISPLEVELIAALEMLDTKHRRLPQPRTDSNVYTLGEIAGHNVVIVGMPQTGNCSAATVMAHARWTFPNLQLCLLEGIGGGVPVTTDNGMIGLGDVVVSKPTGPYPGVIQYDRGKAKTGHFQPTGALPPPPAVLLNAAQDLAADRARSRTDPLAANIARIDTTIRGLRKYRYPGRVNDHLYRPSYIHPVPGRSCSECICNPAQRIRRRRAPGDDYVVVHRGTIASGELVMRSGQLRDKLARQYDILCFETEAAGVLTDFPCMVIRGISDYSDSHKDDLWQGYAAAAAAAYARELFFHIPINAYSS